MSKKLATDSTPSFSIDSSGRVYRRFMGQRGSAKPQWIRLRGVNAQQIIHLSQSQLQKHLKIVRFQRWVIWGCVVLAVVLAWRGCR